MGDREDAESKSRWQQSGFCESRNREEQVLWYSGSDRADIAPTAKLVPFYFVDHFPKHAVSIPTALEMSPTHQARLSFLKRWTVSSELSAERTVAAQQSQRRYVGAYRRLLASCEHSSGIVLSVAARWQRTQLS